MKWLALISLAAAAKDPVKTPINADLAATVTTFARAAATRDVAAIGATLDPSAVQHVRMGGVWSALPTETYLSLMREGRIGGEAVEVEIHSVTTHRGAVATVHATRTTPSHTFDDVFTLVSTGERWLIANVAVVVTPVAK